MFNFETSTLGGKATINFTDLTKKRVPRKTPIVSDINRKKTNIKVNGTSKKKSVIENNQFSNNLTSSDVRSKSHRNISRSKLGKLDERKVKSGEQGKSKRPQFNKKPPTTSQLKGRMKGDDMNNNLLTLSAEQLSIILSAVQNARKTNEQSFPQIPSMSPENNFTESFSPKEKQLIGSLADEIQKASENEFYSHDYSTNDQVFNSPLEESIYRMTNEQNRRKNSQPNLLENSQYSQSYHSSQLGNHPKSNGDGRRKMSEPSNDFGAQYYLQQMHQQNVQQFQKQQQPQNITQFQQQQHNGAQIEEKQHNGIQFQQEQHNGTQFPQEQHNVTQFPQEQSNNDVRKPPKFLTMKEKKQLQWQKEKEDQDRLNTDMHIRKSLVQNVLGDRIHGGSGEPITNGEGKLISRFKRINSDSNRNVEMNESNFNGKIDLPPSSMSDYSARVGHDRRPSINESFAFGTSKEERDMESERKRKQWIKDLERQINEKKNGQQQSIPEANYYSHSKFDGANNSSNNSSTIQQQQQQQQVYQTPKNEIVVETNNILSTNNQHGESRRCGMGAQMTSDQQDLVYERTIKAREEAEREKRWTKIQQLEKKGHDTSALRHRYGFPPLTKSATPPQPSPQQQKPSQQSLSPKYSSHQTTGKEQNLNVDNKISHKSQPMQQHQKMKLKLTNNSSSRLSNKQKAISDEKENHFNSISLSTMNALQSKQMTARESSALFLDGLGRRQTSDVHIEYTPNQDDHVTNRSQIHRKVYNHSTLPPKSTRSTDRSQKTPTIPVVENQASLARRALRQEKLLAQQKANSKFIPKSFSTLATSNSDERKPSKKPSSDRFRIHSGSSNVDIPKPPSPATIIPFRRTHNVFNTNQAKVFEKEEVLEYQSPPQRRKAPPAHRKEIIIESEDVDEVDMEDVEEHVSREILLQQLGDLQQNLKDRHKEMKIV
ncbi:hypothetical protein SNEBB_003713 [Seison nebaliae]|nr:hypothetical protein SNEBB_003713 [Seison nebaliae]